MSVHRPDSLSIVVPTYNERENVGPLLTGLDALRRVWPGDVEVVVVDDRSPDGTAETCERLATPLGLAVRVIRRPPPRSLGRAIVEGIRQSRGDLVCVMDADLSHPPHVVVDLLHALDGADGVVASRYAPGGGLLSWPRSRRIVSLAATAFARGLVLTPCTDPVSGFFLFRRDALAGVPITGLGNKPLLEILTRKPLTVHEVPYEFRDRTRGSSKLGPRSIVDFARLVASLAWESVRRVAFGESGDAESAAEARGP